MKKKIALIISALTIFNVVSIASPTNLISKTTETIAYAQDIPDNVYTDEQGSFRIMVRITSDNAKIKDGIYPWSKVLYAPKKGEMFNYRGKPLSHTFSVCVGTKYGTDKDNYCGWLNDKYGEVVKLYNDGTVVLLNN